MPALHDLRFRSSPHVELKQLGDLGSEQRQPFLELEKDPDFYGLFVASPPLRMNIKAVARQTAELFRTLATPSCLALRDGHDTDDVIDLVLDGILEIESGDGFVSGADALPVICPSSGHTAPPTSNQRPATSDLSRDALLHAQDLETNDPQALTTALYLYNRIPMSPFWKTRFASREAVLSHISADRDPLRALLERHWIASTRANGWLSWSSRTSAPRNAEDVTYKLYVSVRPERIRDAFEIVVRVLAGYPGIPFKIGDGVAGLLRPDKLVAYFATREELGDAAAELHRELAGCDAHGVPFTAALDGTGLLSWGVDPPDNDRALQWLGRESWRYWVAQRLGAALAIAKSAHTAAAVEPWRFAIERARRHGVDAGTWTPSATLWSAA